MNNLFESIITSQYNYTVRIEDDSGLLVTPDDIEAEFPEKFVFDAGVINKQIALMLSKDNEPVKIAFGGNRSLSISRLKKDEQFLSFKVVEEDRYIPFLLRLADWGLAKPFPLTPSSPDLIQVIYHFQDLKYLIEGEPLRQNPRYREIEVSLRKND